MTHGGEEGVDGSGCLQANHRAEDSHEILLPARKAVMRGGPEQLRNAKHGVPYVGRDKTRSGGVLSFGVVVWAARKWDGATALTGARTSKARSSWEARPRSSV